MSPGRPVKTPGGASTTRRGYDGAHRKARTKALKELQEGEPCPFCGRGMFLDQDLDFDHEVPVALGGKDGPKRLSHAACNRAAGGRLAASLRSGREKPGPVPSPPRVDGMPCYECGRPVAAEQGARLVARVYGPGRVWSHVHCPVRWLSVPAGLV